MKAQKQPYLPYMGLEFHLAESVKTHRKDPKFSDHHFVAAGMFQEAQFEKDLDKKIQKIKEYKAFCKEHSIKAYSFKEKVAV